MHMYSAKFLTREPKPDWVLVHKHFWGHCVASGPAGRAALPVSGGVLGRENVPLILNAIRSESTREIKSALYLAERDGANVVFFFCLFCFLLEDQPMKNISSPTFFSVCQDSLLSLIHIHYLICTFVSVVRGRRSEFLQHEYFCMVNHVTSGLNSATF